MQDDQNKTSLTKDVTAAAIGYLDGHGFKPVETEVPVCSGWVADIAGIIEPTPTELIALRLIEKSPRRWDDPRRMIWRDLAKAMAVPMTAIVEVKTSLSDFRSDRKWGLAAPVNLAYVAAPKNLLTGQNIPAGWGVLALHGSAIRLEVAPSVNRISVDQQLATLLRIAVRRDHSTRYERLRDLRRQESDRRKASITLSRMITAMHAMESIIHGKHGTALSALEYHGIKNMPSYYLKELDRLWAILPSPGAR